MYVLSEGRTKRREKGKKEEKGKLLVTTSL